MDFLRIINSLKKNIKMKITFNFCNIRYMETSEK